MTTANVMAEDVEAAGNAARAGSARGALVSLALCMLLASLGTSIGNVALPALAQAFSASFQEVQWVVLAYLLAVTTLVVSVGRLGDLLPRRQLLLAGILVFTLGSALCGAAPTLWALAAARAVQGLGAAVLMALSLALVSETVPKAKAGSAMGWLGTMSALGTALGPAVGGVLLAWFGWRAIFLASVPVGILAALLVRRHLPVAPQRPRADGAGFDKSGMVLLAASLAAYALAMTVGAGRFGALNLTLLSAGVLGACLFVTVERRAASPLIQLGVLRDPELRASLALAALVSAVLMATLVVGPFHLSRALGLDAARVGFNLSIGPLVTALTGVPAGRAVDRYGARRVAIAGLGGIAAGAFSLSVMPVALGVPGYVVAIMVLTGSYALFQTANNTAVMTGLRSDQRGVVSGMLNLSRNLGLITGASLLGGVFAHAAAAADITAARPEEVVAGMRTTFGVAAMMILVGIAVGLGNARAKADPRRLASTGLGR